MSVRPAKIMIQWIRFCRDDVRYYFPKAIDLFAKLPETHQKVFVEHFSNVIPNNRWNEKAFDNTRYMELVRSVLFYYSGKNGSHSPSREVFATEVAKLLRSDEWKEADEFQVTVKSREEFTTGLEAL